MSTSRCTSGTVAMLATLVAAAAAGTVTTDPRCAGYTCTLDANRPFDPGFPSDPATCSNGTFCPQCLTGPVWEQRIADLNSRPGSGFRPTDFYILVNNWLSAEITDNIAKMLLSEVLGYEAPLAPVPVDGSMDIICCTETVLEFEKWPSGRFPSDDGYFTVSSLPVGYTGGSGLWVPTITADAFPLATSYNAYKYLPEYGNIFPRGMSTDCRDLIKDPALGCVEGNYHCDDNTWTNTSCRQGRYVPPQCEADPTSCQELYHAHPGWDQARFEALIKNTGLRFVIAYVGTGLPDYIRQRTARGQHSMFYWWAPDPLPASVGAQEVAFPSNTLECEAANRAGNGDPTLSGYDCAYPKAGLLKLGRRADLLRDPALKHFFDSFSLTGTDMDAMLVRHTAAGGAQNSWNVSCDWVRGNFARWQSWIRSLETAAPVVASADDNTGVVAASIIVPVVAIAIAAAVVYQVRKQAAVKNAPKKPPLALIFTDIESSTYLWERYGQDMAGAVDMHHEIVRECIADFQGYEVKTIGDAFMIACPTVLDAAMLCLDIQTKLYDAPWPETLVDWKAEVPGAEYSAQPGAGASAMANDAADFARKMDQGTGFRGLNVRMGIHLCNEVEAKFDVIHQRFDYYGHDVNVSARMQGAAQGAQILLSEETFTALREDPDFESALGSDCAHSVASRGLELKGVAEPVVVHSIQPAHLAHRRFEPLEGAPGEDDDAADPTSNVIGGIAADTGSVMSLEADFASAGIELGAKSVLQTLLDKRKKLGEEAIDVLCKHYNLPTKGAMAKKMRMVVRAVRAENAQGSASASTSASQSMQSSVVQHAGQGASHHASPSTALLQARARGSMKAMPIMRGRPTTLAARGGVSPSRSPGMSPAQAALPGTAVHHQTAPGDQQRSAVVEAPDG